MVKKKVTMIVGAMPSEFFVAALIIFLSYYVDYGMNSIAVTLLE